MIRLWAVPLLLALAGFAPRSEAAPPIRAIFDEGNYWAGSPTDIQHVLKRIKRAGFNTYIPCVWHGQGTMWPSKIGPVWDANPALAKRDSLGYFIKAAHAEDVKVFPCFTLMLRQRQFLREFASDSRPEGMFDVQNPRFRQFMAGLVVEVAARYEVDGVNLDYVRAGQVCYDARCQQHYRESQGRELMADLAIHKINDAAFNSIVSWQRKAVRSLIKDIADLSRRARPGLMITVDAAPWAETVIIEGQDSLAWSEAGIVDLVFSMNYQPEVDWSLMEQLKHTLGQPNRLAVMVANYDGEQPAKPRPRSGAALAELVRQAATFNADGSYAVYIYSLLTNEQISALALLNASLPATRP